MLAAQDKRGCVSLLPRSRTARASRRAVPCQAGHKGEHKSEHKGGHKPSRIDRRQRMDLLAAEVEGVVAHLGPGIASLPPPLAFMAQESSTSADPSHSCLPPSSSGRTPAGTSEGPNTPPQPDAAFFGRQREQLLVRLASGTLTAASPAPAAGSAATSNPQAAPPTSTAPVAAASGIASDPWFAGQGPSGPAAAAAGGGYGRANTWARAEVCMGKACSRKGAAAVLAGFRAAASAPGAAGVDLEVAPCSKCMGKCKLAPNVRVTVAGRRRGRVHSGVSPHDAHSILQGSLGEKADLFDFV